MEQQASFEEGVEVARLRDGRLLLVRPIRPDDAPRLKTLFFRLSPRSVYLRFLGTRQELTDADAEYFANVDYQMRMALVATDELTGGQDVVAMALYDNCPGEPGVAEAAFVVEDDYQSQGLGTFLMERLTAYARGRGFCRFQFAIHSSNHRMLRLIRHCGPVVSESRAGGVLEIQAELDPAIEWRQHTADGSF